MMNLYIAYTIAKHWLISLRQHARETSRLEWILITGSIILALVLVALEWLAEK